MGRFIACLLLGALAGACATPGEGLPQESPSLWVDPAAQVRLERGTRKEPFLTLEGALKRAGVGGRIYLAPGTYRTNIRVEHALELNGMQPTGVVLRASDPTRPVIELAPQARVVLVNLELAGGSEGVRIGGLGELTMERCRVLDNAEAGLAFQPGAGRWSQAPLSRLSDCTIAGNRVGVTLESGALHLLKCTISRNREQGLVCRGDSQLGVLASRIDENTSAGALLDLGRKARVTLTQNDLRRNGGDGLRIIEASGGWLRPDRSQVLAEQNNLTSNRGYGIVLIDRASNLPPAEDPPRGHVRLDNNQYMDNAAGLAGGIEPR